MTGKKICIFKLFINLIFLLTKIRPKQVNKKTRIYKVKNNERVVKSENLKNLIVKTYLFLCISIKPIYSYVYP